MLFGDLLAASDFGTTGYLASADDVAALDRMIELNLDVLRTFRRIAVATNYGATNADELRAANREVWRARFPDCVLIDSPVNRGHSIGTADLDTLLFDWCKRTGGRWLCKSANDVALSPRVLQIQVRPAQFYYLNAVSYDALAEHGFDFARFEGDFFFPQDTFWVLDVQATDHLVAREFLDASWRIVTRIPDYSGRIWEVIPGWSCERLLQLMVLRNGLTRCALMSPEQWRQVLDLTVERRITDCSLKGIDVNGICHTQGLADPRAPLAVVG